MMGYHVYLLRCEGGELYAGITTDLQRRFAEHVSGGLAGAKYTKAHKPVRIEASWKMPDRASASALEFRMKRLSHAQKEALCEDAAAARPLVVESLARATRPRVLMLGNSFTTSHDISGLIANLEGCEVVVHARGGARLSEHLNPETRMGAMTAAALDVEGWTHVVLQERSDGPVRSRDAYLRAMSALAVRIREAGAIPVVYATWAYAPGSAKLERLGVDHAEMHERLQSSFAEAARENDAVLANVGQAFYDSPDARSLYAADLEHPSAAGASLAAGILATAINDSMKRSRC